MKKEKIKLSKREIKFRAWDKKERLYKDIKQNFWYFSVYDLMQRNIDFSDLNNWDIMQYTGLKDKNGKDIYEGDIVIKYPSKSRGNRKIESYDGIKFEIRYQKEWACFMADAGRLSWLFELAENEKWDGSNEKFLTNNCEIIGNIYENKNLLEK